MLALIKRNRSYVVCLSLLFIVRGSFADQNRVPSGSMEPTIQVGDQILVNRFAYDLKVPFSEITLVHFGEPKRGDIVVFHNPKSDVRMVKRIVGIPGDHLQIRDGVISVNGSVLSGAEEELSALGAANGEAVYVSEQIGHHSVTIKRTPFLFRQDNVDVEIPAGQFFAMGDNRDNSFDSRAWGLVPQSKIVGRAERVLFNIEFFPHPKVRPERIGRKLI